MFPAKTRTDLVRNALGVLGFDAAGQPLAAEDFAKMDEFVGPTIAGLAAAEVVYLDNPNAIPVEYFVPVGTILAYMAAPSFGVSRGGDGDPDSLETRRAIAERDIRLMNRSRYNPADHVASDFGSGYFDGACGCYGPCRCRVGTGYY